MLGVFALAQVAARWLRCCCAAALPAARSLALP